MHRDYRLDGADMSRRLPSSPPTPLFSRLIHRSTPDTFNAYAYPDSSRCIDCACVCVRACGAQNYRALGQGATRQLAAAKKSKWQSIECLAGRIENLVRPTTDEPMQSTAANARYRYTLDKIEEGNSWVENPDTVWSIVRTKRCRRTITY